MHILVGYADAHTGFLPIFARVDDLSDHELRIFVQSHEDTAEVLSDEAER